MLYRLSRELDSFETYARLYAKSARLKSSLVDAYKTFLDFCLAAKKLLSKDPNLPKRPQFMILITSVQR